LITTLPSLEEGTRSVSLDQFKRGSSVEAGKFFNPVELEKKLGEKKNRVKFFKEGVLINDALPDTIYRGMQAFQTADLPPPRVVVEWSETPPGWTVAVTNPLSADPTDPTGCADRHGKLCFSTEIALKDGDRHGRDLTTLAPHTFSAPQETHSWFLPADSVVAGVAAKAGGELVVGTRSMGWVGTVRLPAPGERIDTGASEETLHATWELWESHHDRSRLFPGERDGDAHAVTNALKTHALHLVDGALIRDHDQAAVYVVMGGAKFHVPNMATFDAMGFHWKDVRVTEPGTAAAVPDVPEDGTLLHETGAGAVWVMQGGARIHVPNPDAFATAGFLWERVRAVPPGALARLPIKPWEQYRR
jgi:hypothetical protein